MASLNLEKFQYAIHIIFIEINGEKIPYHIHLTSTETYETVTLGLVMKDIEMNYQEIEFTLKNVKEFPRPPFLDEQIEYTHTYILDNARDTIYRILHFDFCSQDTVGPVFATTDRDTYDYIISIFQNCDIIKLLQQSTFGQDLSLGIAIRYGDKYKTL